MMSFKESLSQVKTLSDLCELLEIPQFAENYDDQDFPIEMLFCLSPHDLEENFIFSKEQAKKIFDALEKIQKHRNKKASKSVLPKIVQQLFYQTSVKKPASYLSHFDDLSNLHYREGDDWPMDPCSASISAVTSFVEHDFNGREHQYRAYRNADGWTPLMYASALGRIRVVELLLSDNPDISLRNNSGQTALMIASSYGHTVIVKKFIEYADKKAVEDANHVIGLHIADNKGYTALHYAVHYAQDDIVEILLRLGADPNKADNEGMTPTLMACVDEIRESSLPVLLKYKGNLTAKNEDGKDGIDLSGDRETVKKLFEEYKASSQENKPTLL